MAFTPVTEFITFTLKHPENLPSASFDSVLSTLRTTAGVTSLHHGTQLEDPTTHLVVARWSSHDAFQSFSTSEHYTPWLADFKALAAHSRFFQALMASDAAGSPDVDAALDAPCTEVLFAHDIDSDADNVFLRNLRSFSENMAARGQQGEMKGWHGQAWGEVTTPIAKEWDGETGPAGALLVGWDSKEAHLEAKAAPNNPIMDNIGLLREHNSGLNMFHVNLRKL